LGGEATTERPWRRGLGRCIFPCVGSYSSAFPVAGPKTWNALPEDATSSQSEYAFRHQLKMWIFKKSFPDIII